MRSVGRRAALPPAAAHSDTQHRTNTTNKKNSVPAKIAFCSPDGSKLAAVREEGVDIYDVTTSAKVRVVRACRACAAARSTAQHTRSAHTHTHTTPPQKNRS